jgi:hypothetical protein
VSEEPTAAPSGAHEMEESEIRALLTRLGRPNANGGTVIERAALLAEGADFDATVAWILAHGGEPEIRAAAAPRGGLYGSRSESSSAAASQKPRRFVLPPGALQR